MVVRNGWVSPNSLLISGCQEKQVDLFWFWKNMRIFPEFWHGSTPLPLVTSLVFFGRMRNKFGKETPKPIHP